MGNAESVLRGAAGIGKCVGGASLLPAPLRDGTDPARPLSQSWSCRMRGAHPCAVGLRDKPKGSPRDVPQGGEDVTVASVTREVTRTEAAGEVLGLGPGELRSRCREDRYPVV